MRPQTLQIETTVLNSSTTKLSSLGSRSDQVLVAIATLGLVATIVDGQADYREIESFTREFRRRFALSRRYSLRLIAAALRRVRLAAEENVTDCACDTLNEHLDSSQKIQLFEGIAEVLVADGSIHGGEEYFLDYLANKLGLVRLLENRYPSV